MPMTKQVVDFSNTEIAFSDKSDNDLIKKARLFNLMNKPWVVNLGAKLGLTAMKLHFPFAQAIIKATIFEQFVGGVTLLESQITISNLSARNSFTILDYGAEAKESEQDFNKTMSETIRALEFASSNESVPIVSAKITGLARFELLEKIQNEDTLNRKELREYRSALKRIDSICHVAWKKKVGVFFDAEESWIQSAIDHIVGIMMKRYNQEKVIVYNTFQLYRTDRLQYLVDSFNLAESKGYMLGAKLVRGAYMEKERTRAKELGYADPIHPNKEATDDAYNTALRFCVDNYKRIASCNATHNEQSCLLQAKLIAERNIQRDHAHLNFCQLFGMSDHLTFNLASAGYNVAKYVPYGPIKEVFPYLLRRAQENTSVTGDMSREYQFVEMEMKRRKLH